MSKEKSFVAFPSGGEVTAGMIAEFIGRAVCVSLVKDRDQLRNNFEPQ